MLEGLYLVEHDDLRGLLEYGLLGLVRTLAPVVLEHDLRGFCLSTA